MVFVIQVAPLNKPLHEDVRCDVITAVVRSAGLNFLRCAWQCLYFSLGCSDDRSGCLGCSMVVLLIFVRLLFKEKDQLISLIFSSLSP